jgi:CheY-like chemotaxis protein
MTVLIADNDRAVGGLLAEVLAQSGLTTCSAFDGQEASRMARCAEVRVLVCDLDMPGMSGLEVLESLRDLPHPPKSVVISGYLDEKIEQRLRALPFVQEVMRKPFDLLAFAAVVRRLADAEPKLSGGGQIVAEH